ncbi:MAG: hypothetical protein HRF50_05400 [Phycisphaerae bacterium]|jgi:hypothetical protein
MTAPFRAARPRRLAGFVFAPGLALLAVLVGCTPQAGPTGLANELMNPPAEVTLVASDLAGPGGALLFEGERHVDALTVPYNTLVGVYKDGQVYLYHPALGDEPVSEYNSRRAAGYFLVGQLDASGKGNMLAQTRMGATGSVRLRTGVDFSRQDWGNGRVANLGSRWVAVDTGRANALGAQPYVIQPYSVPVPTGYVSGILQFSELLLADSPLGKLDEQLADAPSRDVKLLSTKVESFGSVVRALPLMLADDWLGLLGSDFWASVGEAWVANPELFGRVDALDAAHIVLGAVRVGAKVVIPLDCMEAVIVDFFGGAFVESPILGGLAEDPEALRHLYTETFMGLLDSLAGCGLELLAAPTLAGEPAALAANQALDIYGSGKWVLDNAVLGTWSVVKYRAYDRIELEQPARTRQVTWQGSLQSGESHRVVTPDDALNAMGATMRVEYAWVPDDPGASCERKAGFYSGFAVEGISYTINPSGDPGFYLSEDYITRTQVDENHAVVVCAAPVFPEVPSSPLGGWEHYALAPTVTYIAHVQYDSWWEMMYGVGYMGAQALPPLCTGHYDVSVTIDYASAD